MLSIWSCKIKTNQMGFPLCTSECSTGAVKRSSRKVPRRHREKSATPVALLEAVNTGAVRDALLATQPGIAVSAAANTAVFTLGYPLLSSGLTEAAIVNAWLLGCLSLAALGWRGYIIACTYFALGNAVTKLRIREKQLAGIAERNTGRRTPSSVYGSASAAIVASTAFLAFSSAGYFSFLSACSAAYVASFAAKLADTVSSEIGKGFGRVAILPTTLKGVKPGTEGAVSVEGSIAGLAAGAAMCAGANAIGLVGSKAAVIVLVAVTIANAGESYLGASAQGKVEWLSNDIINVLLIFTAAIIAAGGVLLFDA
jgi:uncharacterized protein (TIGR00297 family)